MTPKIIIVDFGSQYTQLIARRVREQNVYCEILPYQAAIPQDATVRGVILSGGPASVTQPGAPSIALQSLEGRLPVLGICYGAQLMAQQLGGQVAPAAAREYGRAQLLPNGKGKLLQDVAKASQVWMSHADTILALPTGFVVTATTETIPIAAFEDAQRGFYGVQFHPEVTHTAEGAKVLRNFILAICGMQPSWTPASFVTTTQQALAEQLAGASVVCALSGGVDSTVAATLLHQAIGKRLHCIFVNNGLLRKDEYSQVMSQYESLGLQLHGVNASERFLQALAGQTDPEQKRKTIGRVFIEVLEEEARKLPGITHLAQGTIYPDVIESISVKGPSATIKSHHNVGGLPARMQLQVVEPLRYLFKDEVRRVGTALGLPDEILQRHPFPGPGLAIRVLGEVTPARVTTLQQADAIFIQELKAHQLYHTVWQAFSVLLPVSTVGVMGDERTYENVLALRAVTSTDGMTADWAPLPHEFLGQVANKIINQVPAINRVVYDISSKPPATIEWE